MSVKFLRLSNGVPRSFTGAASVPIYDQSILIVVSGATGNQLNGPVTAGTSVTLPAAQTYSSAELQIYLGGDRLEPTIDYNYVGSGARTQVQFTFDLLARDRIDFRIDREA